MKEIKKSASFTSKQKGKDVKFNIDLNYSPEYDSFIIKIKEGEGFMAYSSNIERMPLKVIQKLNEMLEEVLIKAGSETEMEKQKMSNGGDFQAGVYAKGGSLQAHGIEIGDTFVKTISGNIQKIKDKNGKIVYVDLSTGERDSQPPLPFENGGGIGMEEDKDTWQNLLEQFGFKKGRSRYGLDMYYKNGYTASVDKNLRNVDLMFEDNVLYKGYSIQGLLYTLENQFGKTKMATGGALVGNQKRIDMNKNGKIDAEDFKLLRSSMNGAWRNERKHVNHNEDYEVRYARKKPSRTGYKGKRKFEGGGGISNFERFSNVVAKNYEGKSVKPKYQKEYGKTYSKSEAKQVGNRVAGKVKMMKKAESGAEVKKGKRGGVMVLAKKIRKDGESWKDALKRAGQQLK
jgi:hypothetical protein